MFCPLVKSCPHNVRFEAIRTIGLSLAIPTHQTITPQSLQHVRDRHTARACSRRMAAQLLCRQRTPQQQRYVAIRQLSADRRQSLNTELPRRCTEHGTTPWGGITKVTRTDASWGVDLVSYGLAGIFSSRRRRYANRGNPADSLKNAYKAYHASGRDPL